MKVKRALISVYNKDGIEEFAAMLTGLGIEIFSSGGTAKFLHERNIPVVQISDVTGFPEILAGRVKTMHPRISAGILALRDKPEHVRQLDEHQIKMIDLVVVNLYPFLSALSEHKAHQNMLELIDIGGPTLIRAAAKNHPHVAVVTSPQQLQAVAGEMQNSGGEISAQLRQKLAREAFQHTAYYDAMIADYFAGLEGRPDELPSQIVLPLQQVSKMRYGENPHQQAGFYQSSTSPDIEGIEQLNGIQLSYNNLMDVDAAISAVNSFREPAVVIVKHTNPCGIGSDVNVEPAYQKALATDPISAFGGILCTNQTVTMNLAESLKKHFLEVLIAPDFEPEALGKLRKKRKLRILKYFPNTDNRPKYCFRSSLNGMLVQFENIAVWDEEKLKVVTEREPTADEWQALAFNWRVVKHVKSNAIVFGLKDRTLGIGAGQMSRVDSVELAVQKSGKSQLSLHGSVLASDAFFPFRDGVDAAAQAGVTAIVQPGGSIRDEEVVAAANEQDIAMVFTGMRHFRH
ncbi:MAG TPA: bifunctional phosphoribosylaminoimidazolecarboxamide formyltransferase/IMP cyclohydrolase [Bacteroidetes bacterium]|nr:bifunctional phosphoribosylaminoimidazolecarboxamide formyltransferase/IMP cyclohydrolase [Bacteroidota bacterium]